MDDFRAKYALATGILPSCSICRFRFSLPKMLHDEPINNFEEVIDVCRNKYRIKEIEDGIDIQDGHIGIYECAEEDYCEYFDSTLSKLDSPDAISATRIMLKHIKDQKKLETVITEEDVLKIARLTGCGELKLN